MLEGNTILLKTGHFEFRMRHLLVVAVLIIAFTTAFIMRSYPAKYGFYLNEYDPYYNYRATKYILDHGLDSYLKWHDTMSWYPEGRDIAKTSQSGLHIVTAFLYTIFGRSVSLLDFTIIFPVVIGSLTTIVAFALVRALGSGSTTAGMFAALLFAFSPPLIERGNLGWFKSEPLGLFFGILALYLIVSAIRYAAENEEGDEKKKKMKYDDIVIILKSAVGGIMLGLANASWGGAQYFVIPISLFFIALPFFRRADTIKILLYIATIFTVFTILTALAFPRPPVPFVFGFSTSHIPLVGPGIMLIFSTIFMVGAYSLMRLSNSRPPTKKVHNRLLFFLLIAFFVIVSGIVLGGVLRHISSFRYVSIINPFAVPTNALVEFVAEHAKPTLTDYWIDFSILLFFAGVGVWMALKHRRDAMSIFVLIIGITAIYVSTGLIRLLVYASLGIIVFAAIGLYQITTRTLLESRDPLTINNKRSTTITYKEKRSDVIKVNENTSKEGGRRKTITLVASIALIMFLLVFPMTYPPELNFLSLANIPPTILNGGTSYVVKSNDWLNALNWISTHTPKKAVIAAWWDYGYWITVLGNRTSLADNATINQTRIATIAKMFMEKPENGIRIAVSNLKADYILIYVVAQRTQLPRGGSFYTLGYGGDESKTFGFIRIGGFDEQKYINQDRYTPIFWNSTLIGKLIPFKPEGYTLFRNGQPTTALFQDYKPGAFTVYSQYIKYPENGTNSREQPLSLVYSSPSFLSNNSGIISAVLIYKVNYDSYFQKP